MEEVDDSIKRLQEDYPFLSYFQYGDKSVLGIIQNVTNQFVMIYDLDRIRDQNLKKRFLNFGDKWWFESNAKMPIDVFIGRDFDVFSESLAGYSKKEIKEIIGPTVNLDKTFNKRIKKRKVEFSKLPQP